MSHLSRPSTHSHRDHRSHRDHSRHEPYPFQHYHPFANSFANHHPSPDNRSAFPPPDRRAADEELALRLHSEELANAAAFDVDRTTSHRLQQATQRGPDATRRPQRAQRLTHGNRQAAAPYTGIGGRHALHQTVGRDRSPPRVPQWLNDFLRGQPGSSATAEARHSRPRQQPTRQARPPSPIPVIHNNFTDSFFAGTSDDGQRQSPATAESRHRTNHQPTRVCECCQDRKPGTDLSRAPCGHEYCRQCLSELFSRAAGDESMYPPRCCRQEIPLAASEALLPRDVAERFRAKAAEFSTPDRTYCHRRACAAFVPPSRIGGDDGVARCGACHAGTCAACKGPAHRGAACPHDHELQRVLSVARREGWQRCPQCGNMIELESGCFHMTCKCGSQFCYVCGVPWKNCDCLQFDEAHLIY